MSKRDYYDVLGVSKGATDTEIKRAFRKKAMELHPDRNKDSSPDRDTKFKEANEAYDVLKDKQKRAAYDQMGHAAFDQNMGYGGGAGFGGSGGFDPSDLGDIFGEMFGDVFGGGRRGGPQRAQKGADLRHDIKITLEEAFNGKDIELNYTARSKCSHCNGTGAENPDDVQTCPTCNGSGQVRMSQGFFTMSRPCSTCGGSGKIIKNPCSYCHGNGTVNERQNIKTTIPAGIDDGQQFRLAGKGEASMNGGPNGDLYIYVSVKAHKYFERHGSDLYVKAELNIAQASLGAQVDVPTIKGTTEKLTIPAGTQANQKFRIKNEGMPVINSSTKGDLYIITDIIVPKKLNSEQKELLEKLGKTFTDKKGGFSSFFGL